MLYFLLVGVSPRVFGWRYSHDGLVEPMLYFLLVGVSPRVFRWRYSHDGLAEPMLHLSLSVAAPEYSSVLTATVFLSSSEEVLDSGLLFVDADEFSLLSAAAPEYSGVLTATVFLSSSEEVLDSGLLLVRGQRSRRVCKLLSVADAVNKGVRLSQRSPGVFACRCRS